MSNIIISRTAIELLAEELGVDFNVPHNTGYMGPDNEKGLFVDAISQVGGFEGNYLDDNIEYLIADEERFATAFGVIFRAYKEAEAEVGDAQ